MNFRVQKTKKIFYLLGDHVVFCEESFSVFSFKQKKKIDISLHQYVADFDFAAGRSLFRKKRKRTMDLRNQQIIVYNV